MVGVSAEMMDVWLKQIIHTYHELPVKSDKNEINNQFRWCGPNIILEHHFKQNEYKNNNTF